MKRIVSLFVVFVFLTSAFTTAFAYEELKKGSKGEAVIALQNRLNELNYNCGKADGSYGNGTASAVKEFQLQNNLEVTGIADEKTQEALFDENCPVAKVYEKLDWKGDSRNPSDYKGKYVKFDGRVLQVMDGVVTTGTRSDGGVWMSNNNYGLRVATKGKYDNVVYIIVSTYDVEGGRILEGDTITVYGQYDGIYDYTTVLGAAQSIPKIQGESVIIK